jgi:tripartite-type tricarboxylate transporter receptor subunit TctC
MPFSVLIMKNVRLALAMYFAMACMGAIAQTYPSKPIRLVITFPPGGSTDVVARLVCARLGEVLGQPIVIDNRPGAGGAIGADAVIKSAPDGYTLLLGPTGAITINPSLYPKLTYDPRDLVPITPIARAPFVLLAPIDSPLKSIRDVIEASKTRSVSYGSGGNGSAMHLSGEHFLALAGIKMLHVPFKSSGAASTTMIGQGEPNLVWADTATMQAALRTGRVRVLGVSLTNRTPLLPDVPTVAEQGVPGYESIGWFGFFAPSGTAQPIIDRIVAETARVLAKPALRDRILATANEPWATSQTEFQAFVRAETAKWGRIVRESGAKVD